MSRLTAGSLRLFRFAGVDVYLHWSWLLLALLEMNAGDQGNLLGFESSIWNISLYLTLFGIVLLHEFGHALACQQVGGQANAIVLWPLGGVAYVQPPPRPGAVLWSIAAGPFVNVILVPVTILMYLLTLAVPRADIGHFCKLIVLMNLGLLIFNLLPIFPMDGGQIVYALLWFVIGRVNSLYVVSVIGLVISLPALVGSLLIGSWWLVFMAGYMTFRCVISFQVARQLATLLSGPRHMEFACPSCGEAPFAAKLWTCDACRCHFDTFEHKLACPDCGQPFATTMCPSCRSRHPIGEWRRPADMTEDEQESALPYY